MSPQALPGNREKGGPRRESPAHNPLVTVIRDAGVITADDAVSKYVAACMHHGVAFYLDHADISMQALSVDGQVLPLVINAGSNRESSAWSPYAHYYRYTLEEFSKRHGPIASAAVQALASPLGAALRTIFFDKVVFANNLIFATNPGLRLSAVQIREVTRCLLEEYRDFAIIFRSISTQLDESACAALTDSGYRLVRSHRVYLLDCRGTDHLRHKNIQIDLKLLKSSPYELIGCNAQLEAHASRMAELYRGVYLDKHSHLNPPYNPEFFRLTLRENVLFYQALSKDGRIDAFVGFCLQDEVMSATILGYDQTLPRKCGLYRAAIALLISEATRRKLVLNLGAGVEKFKMLRGAVPAEKFDAVYDHHLPAPRRLAWAALMQAARWRATKPPPGSQANESALRLERI